MKSLLRPVKGAFCFLMGAASALAFAVSQEGYTGMSAMPAAQTSYLFSALGLLFGLLFFHVYVKKRLRPGWLGVLMAVVFGMANAFGLYLFSYDTWRMSRMTLLLTFGKGVLQSLPMMAAFAWMHEALANGLLGRGQDLPWFQSREVLWLMGIFILCWSPYLIAFFPGTVCWDLGEMVAQFFGQTEMNTWHGVFTTWLIGGCVWLGRLLGSDNLGAALFTALQTLLLSYALAKAVARLKTGRGFKWIAAAFFALTPIWGGYAQFISKDTLYTAALLLFTLAVIGRRALPMFVWGLLACLLRANGLYVVLPTAVVAIVVIRRLRATVALAGAVACAMLFSNVLIPALGIQNATAGGIYSVCFQQSARVLRDHEETPEEFAAIDSVLDAQNLPELYEPWISDPVKYTFRQYGTDDAPQALAQYRSAWLAMFAKYPLTYAEAFFAGNLSYYTFAPKLEGETYNNQAGNRLVFETYELGDSRGYDPRFLDTTQIGSLEPARRLLALFARGWRHIPVLALLYACATYTWTLVGAAVSVVRQRRYAALLGFLPALMSLGVCMLSPVNDYFRYFLPVAAMTMTLIGEAKSASH